MGVFLINLPREDSGYDAPEEAYADVGEIMLSEVQTRPDIYEGKKDHGNGHDLFSHKEEEEGGKTHVVRRMRGEEAEVLLAIAAGDGEHETQFLYIARPRAAYERFDDEVADACRQCETYANGTDTHESLTIVGVAVNNQIQERYEKRHPHQRVGETKCHTVYKSTITAPKGHDAKAVERINGVQGFKGSRVQEDQKVQGVQLCIMNYELCIMHYQISSTADSCTHPSRPSERRMPYQPFISLSVIRRQVPSWMTAVSGDLWVGRFFI